MNPGRGLFFYVRRSSPLHAARAGVRDGGAVLVRPDGFIGFRAVPADTAGMNALDRHLASYLVPPRG